MSKKVINIVEEFIKKNKPALASTHQSVWSISDIRMDQINEVSFKGKGYTLVDPYAWVQSFHTAVNVPLPDNPTWLDLWDAVDKGIKQSGDSHHVFIERFVVDRRKKTVVVSMGS